MINDKAILVGVDGSHASYKATWWAANYAKHAGLTLQIVCAYSLPILRVWASETEKVPKTVSRIDSPRRKTVFNTPCESAKTKKVIHIVVHRCG